MDTIPSLKDELERKTLTEMERILMDTKKGRMTEREARSSIRTLFNAVSGLVDDEIVREHLSMVAKEIDKCPAVELLEMGGKYTLIDVRDFETATIYQFNASPKTVSLDKVPALINRLTDLGYEQC